MSYLEDFKIQINNRDFSKFLQLWEEYCTSDTVEAEEFVQLLEAIKTSDFAKLFGRFIETALPIWKTINDERESYEVLKHLIDLETTNAPLLAEISIEAIQKRYGQPQQHMERLRLVGLRSREQFQGALSNYDLLAHIDKGKFVFHTGGWGTGEIIDVSHIREQLAVEFENVAGRKHITFINAFKTLIPLSDDHFLALRFSDPDQLEKEAKQNPVGVIKILLRDLGSKTALEIKDELCELVIPAGEWAKWWQAARSKLKKDTLVETPESLKSVFRLRKSAFSHEDQVKHAMHREMDIDEIIQTTYNFVRDMPTMLKKDEVKQSMQSKLIGLFDDPTLTPSQELQILILLEGYFSYKFKEKSLDDFILNLKDVELIVNTIEIVALKKRALALIREYRKDWISLFLTFLFSIQQSTLRDYLLKELNQHEAQKELKLVLQEILEYPTKNPELFVWYFQKIIGKDNQNLLFANKEGQCLFFEAFFILFIAIESKPEYRELLKKMYTMLSGKRYALVRSIIENTSLEFIKEFLLLVSKCQTLSDHDIKILRSLAEVVHPSLSAGKSRRNLLQEDHTIWTTELGYLKIQERARQIGTFEIIDNAREIEAARALGDLRENSEYKFALERRSRLQGELKRLSEQLNRARMITKNDISLSEVGVGNIVVIQDSKKNKMIYTILGPWDADPDSNILSFQSKFAQAMSGLKIGEAFNFRDEEYKILDIKSYLESI